MTGGQFMAVLIVAIVMIASIVKSRYAYRAHHPNGAASDAGAGAAETERLREEVKQLKDRLAVLERITVEKESSLEREIERLRNS